MDSIISGKRTTQIIRRTNHDRPRLTDLMQLAHLLTGLLKLSYSNDLFKAS